MSMLRSILLLACVLGSLAEARPLHELPADAVVVAGELAPADAAAIAALKSAGVGALPDLREQFGPATFEVAAQAVLAGLFERRPTPAEWASVELLKLYEPRLWRRHPETAADWYEPVLDVAGMASRVEAHWRFEDAVTALLRQRPQGWSDWLQAEPGLLSELLKRLPQAELDGLIEAGVPAGLGSGPWLVLLLRSGHGQLWDQALADAPDEALLRAAPEVWSRGPKRARAWLEQLRILRPALSSAAVFAFARDPDSADRQRRMWALLSDPQDRAAAAAVIAQDAQLSDAELMHALEEADAAAAAGHVLALRLRDTAATRAYLLRRDADPSNRARTRGTRP